MIQDAGYDINKISKDLWFGKIQKIHTILVPTVPMIERIIGTPERPIPRSAPGNRSINPHPEEGIIQGTLTHSIFKGVHYEMEVMANGFEWLVQSTKMVPVGTKVGIKVDPFNIQIMKKPESEDEEAIGVNE